MGCTPCKKSDPRCRKLAPNYNARKVYRMRCTPSAAAPDPDLSSTCNQRCCAIGCQRQPMALADRAGSGCARPRHRLTGSGTPCGTYLSSDPTLCYQTRPFSTPKTLSCTGKFWELIGNIMSNILSKLEANRTGQNISNFDTIFIL